MVEKLDEFKDGSLSDEELSEKYNLNFDDGRYRNIVTEHYTDIINWLKKYIVLETYTTNINSEILKKDEDEKSMYNQLKKEGIIVENDEGAFLRWPTNLMGKARIDAQLEADGEDGDNTLISQFGNTMIFLALVIYTILFVFRYLKRLLMLAFLTIIAPFVAMTYPLDKMNDGNAQAFNAWLKEYVYNLLIQPVHLILYTVLIGTAMDFAANNLLYALAALGFILQAEKIMRKFFGFEKASTLAGGSALGGAMAMYGINKLRQIGKGKSGSKGGKGEKDEDKKIRMANRKPDEGKDLNSRLAVRTQQATSQQATSQRVTPQRLTPQQATAQRAASRQGTAQQGTPQRAASRQGTAQQATAQRAASRQGTPQQATSQRAASRQATAQRRGNGKPRRLKGALKAGAKGLAFVGKPLSRLAIRGATAGTGAMIGVAAGLVSEDYSNVTKWGAAGAGAGWIGGAGISELPERIGDTAGSVAGDIAETAEDMASTYTLTAYGNEAEQERINEKMDRVEKRNPEIRKKYAQKFNLQNKKDIDDVMEERQRYRASGVSDEDCIIGAMKLNRRDFGSEEERIMAAQLAQEVGKEEKKLKYVKEELSRNGISDADVEKYEKGIKKINKWTV